MSGERKLLCVGSGWIAARLLAAAGARGWARRVAYQSYRNPAMPDEMLIPLPRARDQWMALCRKIQPDYLVYLLGTSFVPSIEGELSKAIEDNIVSLAHILEATAEAAVPLRKILVAGSASIYAPSDSALREDSRVLPTDTYGSIKAVQERVALSFFERRAMPVVVARQFNTSGAGQDGRFVIPSIAAQVAAAVARGDKAVKLRIGDVEVRRDFLDVRDTVSAYIALLENGAPGGVYNVCSGSASSIGEIARRACKLFGLEALFEVQEDLVRHGERRRLLVQGDDARLRALGWKPQFTLDDLIRGVVQSYLPSARQ